MKSSDPLESDPLVIKIKQTLNNEKQDTDIQQRLKNVRQQALVQSQPTLHSRFFAPAVAFASICMITLVITLSITPTTNPGDIDSIEEFEIITSNDSLEMYENLEFYLWLNNEFKA